ncbi:hypothetical protein RSOL_278570, partial [Rhizoctonia solani AG-3 Rhs1AP]
MRAHKAPVPAVEQGDKGDKLPQMTYLDSTFNDQCEHRFDQLLPGQSFPDLDVEEELLDPDLEDEDELEEDGLFDEFGFPHADDEPPGNEQPFRLPWENQLDNPDPNPEPEPDEDVDPAEYCAAFQEHRLIRNAYIDAVVQKVHHGATQRALTHQLKAAQRQLYDNPMFRQRILLGWP